MKPYQTLDGYAAHVGWTDSVLDHSRMLMVQDWMVRNNYHMKFQMNDRIDLNAGRDFLLEDFTYSVVVLHWLFAGTVGGPNDNPSMTFSKWSKPHRWRRRLTETRAKLIFAFGGFCEVGYSYLQELEQYEVEHVCHGFTVYIRLP